MQNRCMTSFWRLPHILCITLLVAVTAGKDCTCKEFCNYECGLNASKPHQLTVYRMTPNGVLDMGDKDTGDARGDTSFVLSRRLIEYQCRQEPWSPYCNAMTNFDGDDSNSTDLVMSVTVEVDGQWGPYLLCNPRDIKNPHGSWYCDLNIPGSFPVPAVPPPKCDAADFEVFDDYCWDGDSHPVREPATSLNECCGIAHEHKANHFQFIPANKTCEIHGFTLKAKQCKGVAMAFKNPHLGACNCRRAFETVGREDIDVALKYLPGQHPAGGEWYSHPERGRCKNGQQLGDNNCTWRVVSVNKIIRAACMYQHLDGNVIKNDQSCFDKCEKPYNVTSNCYLKCYSESTKSMTKEELAAPWDVAFKHDDVADGGCPPHPGTHV
eukprot:m.205354 g.205354  ORF g.205354 m.205354 type:complete len:381 (+) comp18873_c0_seq3:92-1234(+)